ncbi:hypothetical protein V6M85_04865 [Sulfolobus tengchongensis]|uniref:Uncharacterized protein n=1 Tax=Sulfolobus tengchongensis TaxID=207809 RepID=A0AAX4L2L1_9CREN
MKEVYQLALVSVISILVVVTIVYGFYILLIPIVLFSLYLIKESRIPDIKDLNTFYEYVTKVYGKYFTEIIKQRFNIIHGDLTLAYFPSTLKDNTIAISDNHLILKLNDKAIVMSKYEGVDYLINLIKGDKKL